MKKFLIILLLLGLAAPFVIAQDLELGADMGMVMNPRWKTTFTMGVKGTYPVSKAIAATLAFHYVFSPIEAPAWGGGFKSSVWGLDAGAQYRFNLTNSRLIPYVVCMLGLFSLRQSYNSDMENYAWSKNKMAFAIGMGLILPLMAKLALDFNFRYKIINGLVGDMFAITIGLIYYISLFGGR